MASAAADQRLGDFGPRQVVLDDRFSVGAVVEQHVAAPVDDAYPQIPGQQRQQAVKPGHRIRSGQMVFGDVFRDQRRVNVHSPFELVVSEGSFAVLLDEDDDRRENGEYDQEVKNSFFDSSGAWRYRLSG